MTLQGNAALLEAGSPEWSAARSVYLARFPEAQPMTELGDFRFVAIAVEGARQVAGFGAARSIDAEDLAQILRRAG